MIGLSIVVGVLRSLPTVGVPTPSTGSVDKKGDPKAVGEQAMGS